MQTIAKMVTPLMAATWLARNNGNNRPLNKSHVRMLAREMREGNWRLTHQGIAFDRAGNLLDGQHRLSAVVESDVTVEMIVATDCERETFAHVDCGRKRTPGDVVHMRGIENASAVAATARSALIGSGGNHAFPTRGAVDRFVQAYGDLLQRYAAMMRTYNAPVAAAFVNAELAGYGGIADAASRLISLTFIDDMDPMRALAKRLRELRGRNVQAQKYALTITALKAVHEGRGLKIIRESRGADVDIDHSAILLGTA